MTKSESKHIENHDERKIKLINFISFLFGFAGALLLYVLSDYFREALGSDNVSIFYFIAYAISLLGMLNLHKLVNKFGRSTVFFVFFFLQICLISFLIFVQPSVLGIILLMLYLISTNLAWVALDVILESYSEDKRSGRIRGLHLTIMNIGIL